MDLSAGEGTAALIQPGDLPAVCQTPSKEECELCHQILLKDEGGVCSTADWHLFRPRLQQTL